MFKIARIFGVAMMVSMIGNVMGVITSNNYQMQVRNRHNSTIKQDSDTFQNNLARNYEQAAKNNAARRLILDYATHWALKNRIIESTNTDPDLRRSLKLKHWLAHNELLRNVWFIFDNKPLSLQDMAKLRKKINEFESAINTRSIVD